MQSAHFPIREGTPPMSTSPLGPMACPLLHQDTARSGRQWENTLVYDVWGGHQSSVVPRRGEGSGDRGTSSTDSGSTGGIELSLHTSTWWE